MAYKTIDESFWTDLKLKQLKRDERHMLFYLITNPHGHYSGLYYIPISFIMEETQFTRKEVQVSLVGLQKSERIKYDAGLQIVWVINMFKHQLANGNRANMITGTRKKLQTLHDSYLIKEFLEHYQGLGIEYEHPSEWMGVPITNGTYTVTDTDKDFKDSKDLFFSKGDTLILFEEAWKAYPRKLGKKQALAHYKATVKTKDDHKQLLQAIENYKLTKDYKEGFIQHGSTWFNNWQDHIDYVEPRTTPPVDREKISAEMRNIEVEVDGLNRRINDREADEPEFPDYDRRQEELPGMRHRRSQLMIKLEELRAI